MGTFLETESSVRNFRLISGGDAFRSLGFRSLGGDEHDLLSLDLISPVENVEVIRVEDLRTWSRTLRRLAQEAPNIAYDLEGLASALTRGEI